MMFASVIAENSSAATKTAALPPDIGLTVHAVLPPPVTGMTLCTEAVVQAAQRRVAVRSYNWSNGSARITPWFRLVKFLRAATSPVRLLFGSRPRHAVFYMPCNQGLATLYNLATLSAARIRGYRCVLHHHYYRYVDRFEWRIKLLTLVLRPDDLQIVLCPRMERQFRTLYGSQLALAVMPSTIQLLRTARPEISSSASRRIGPFCLGHVSNLQVAKGLDLVLQVFRELRRQDRDVRLLLAGPIDTAVERRMIHEAQAEFGERLDYRGPVYGADKQKFYRDIDAKIYPTRLDAQPLVIMEAFSYGRPVLSFGRGCIPDMMPRGDWAIDPQGDFVRLAVAKVVQWMDDHVAYAADCKSAREQYVASWEEARAALDNFLRWVCHDNAPGFVRRAPANCSLVCSSSSDVARI